VSASGLPVFWLSIFTSSSARASIASAIRSRARCRSDGVASRQVSNAFSAAVIARSTSASLDTGAAAKTSPVDGSMRSAYRPSAGSTAEPSMKLCNTRLSDIIASRVGIAPRKPILPSNPQQT
jgi:hypothetical protein